MLYYKSNHTLSILPVQAHFNLNKYRTKKLILSNNTFISIEGFLEDIETDAARHATLFHISINNINFLNRATLLPLISGGLDEYFQYFSLFALVINLL